PRDRPDRDRRRRDGRPRRPRRIDRRRPESRRRRAAAGSNAVSPREELELLIGTKKTGLERVAGSAARARAAREAPNVSEREERDKQTDGAAARPRLCSPERLPPQGSLRF